MGIDQYKDTSGIACNLCSGPFSVWTALEMLFAAVVLADLFVSCE